MGRGTLLLIEDDAELSVSLRVKLTQAGFQVTLAESVVGGMIAVREVCPAVVVASVDLPQGEDIVVRVRKMGVPLVLLAQAGGRRKSLLSGVEVIVKPFLFHVLLGRLDQLTDPQVSLQVGDVRLVVEGREVTVSGVTVQVSSMEAELLRALMRFPHRVCSERELMRAIWPGREVHPNSLGMLLMTLRRKLAGAGMPEFIRTVRWYGYGLRP